jgi:hypothetical protein
MSKVYPSLLSVAEGIGGCEEGNVEPLLTPVGENISTRRENISTVGENNSTLPENISTVQENIPVFSTK